MKSVSLILQERLTFVHTVPTKKLARSVGKDVLNGLRS